MYSLFLFFDAPPIVSFLFSSFFFTDPPTTEIYTLSLHDALPISRRRGGVLDDDFVFGFCHLVRDEARFGHQAPVDRSRSEEHTSELQSHHDLVCRLLLEKKNKQRMNTISHNNQKSGSQSNVKAAE